MGVVQAGTMASRLIVKELRKDLMKKCLHADTSYSVIAENSSGEVLGVKLGYIMTNDKKLGRFIYYPELKPFYWALPEIVVNFNTVGWYIERHLGYHPNKAMDTLVRIFISQISLLESYLI